MAEAATVDVAEVLETRKVDAFQLELGPQTRFTMLPLQTTLTIVATPFVIAAGICIALDVVYKRRFAGGEAAAVSAGSAAPVAVTASAGE